MGSIDQLKSEVERLSSELQQACLEKVQAAEYGLAVLDEKQRLQEQYDELETLLESNKQELECLKEVFCRKLSWLTIPFESRIFLPFDLIRSKIRIAKRVHNKSLIF